MQIVPSAKWLQLYQELFSKACVTEPLISEKKIKLTYLSLFHIPWECKCVLQAVGKQSPDSIRLQKMIMDEEYIGHVYPAEDKLTPS